MEKDSKIGKVDHNKIDWTRREWWRKNPKTYRYAYLEGCKDRIVGGATPCWIKSNETQITNSREKEVTITNYKAVGNQINWI